MAFAQADRNASGFVLDQVRVRTLHFQKMVHHSLFVCERCTSHARSRLDHVSCVLPSFLIEALVVGCAVANIFVLILLRFAFAELPLAATLTRAEGSSFSLSLNFDVVRHIKLRVAGLDGCRVSLFPGGRVVEDRKVEGLAEWGA